MKDEASGTEQEENPYAAITPDMYPEDWPEQKVIDHFLEDVVSDEVLLRQWAETMGVSYVSVTSLKEARKASILRAMRQRLFNEAKAGFIRTRYRTNVVPGLLQHAIDRVEFLVDWLLPPTAPDRARFERAFLQAQADYYRKMQDQIEAAVEDAKSTLEVPKQELILPPGAKS